jgi:hypothetical protein
VSRPPPTALAMDSMSACSKPEAATIVRFGISCCRNEVIHSNESTVGGIWAKVNNVSSLQIRSLMYRFHPSVEWVETCLRQRHRHRRQLPYWHLHALLAHVSRGSTGEAE